MPDGTQHTFGFPPLPASRLRPGEIVVDLFAGGGGASTALEQALGRPVDIAINHNPIALAMHAANHPFTRHLPEDVWEADPRTLVAGRAVGWMHASPDCFPAGTMVLTAQGYRPIEEVGIGDLVLTHKGRWRVVTDVMSTERELLTLTGHGHPGLMVSAEHPFLARRRRDVWCTSPRGYRKELDPADWVKADELDRGWYWATPHAFPEASVPGVGGRGMEITLDLLWLAGRYIGDGWTRLTDTHAELVITCGKHEADALRHLLAKWPPQSGRSGFNELAWHERHTSTAYQFTTSHQGLVEWLREHFGHGAAEKRIPGWALGMPRELRQALLEGYCSADGQITDAFIETQSASKALAFGIKALAESLGHTVAVYTGPNRNVIDGRTVNARPVWRCRWRHAVDPAHQQTIRDELHEWAPIRKSEHGTGHGRVYNLSVADDESYVVEGIVVHNCTHFSQAKGGQPRSRATRSLSWVVIRWAGTVRPRCVSLENVHQILQWGPLVAKRCKTTGRVIRLDGSVAAPGERVPVDQQWLVPDKRHAGRTWRRFIQLLRHMGYAVEWRRLKACDYGAGTSRDRLFFIARCDGDPIVWPEPTHGPGRAQPYVTAADCIDWTIPCPSIFERRKPLADATLRRIARGIQRYVIDAATPYFITEFANASNGRTWSGNDPLRTQCAGVKGGHFAVVVPHLTAMAQNVTGNDLRDPLPTVLAGATRFGVVSAFLEQANGGFAAEGPGHDLRQPMSTITASGSQQRLVTCTLSPEQEAGALRVAAFLTTYYGNGDAVSLRDPLDTITTRDRLALVTVTIRGTPYVIVDIGLRMLKPHELYRAQGFPADYIIDRTADGRRLTISQAVAMVGNSVSPPPLRALATANLDPVAERIAA